MGLTILFVDDDKNLLQGIERVVKLERKDVNYRVCDNAKDAVRLLRESEYDALVADYRMPEMDGITLLEMAEKEYPGMLRVLLTGQSKKEVFDRASSIAHRYCSKPFDILELISDIEALIDAKKK